MYVCLYVCMYVRTYVCMYVCDPLPKIADRHLVLVVVNWCGPSGFPRRCQAARNYIHQSCKAALANPLGLR